MASSYDENTSPKLCMPNTVLQIKFIISYDSGENYNKRNYFFSYVLIPFDILKSQMDRMTFLAKLSIFFLSYSSFDHYSFT